MLPDQDVNKNKAQSPKNAKNQNKSQDYDDKKQKEQPRPCCWYFLSWIVFISVFIVYGSFWAIDRYAVQAQRSSYYGVSFPVSTYLFKNQTYTSSTDIFPAATILQADATAMHILYSWFMWKFPLFIFLFEMVSDQKNKKLRFIPWGISLGLCLVGDILSIVFVTWTRDADLNAGTWNYTDWMAYTVFFIFSIIVVSVGNIGNNVKEAVVSNTLLLLFLALMYSSYTILFPGLYNVYVTDIPDIAPYLQIYLFPFFDLIFYSLLLVANAHMSPKAKGFASMFQFLQLGYFVGMNMLVGVTEVQFYYLIAYLIFRNFFVSRVMWDWDETVNNPACLPGWVLLYYLSYLLNTTPIIGLGRIVIGKSFFTQILSLATPILYPVQSSLYSYNTNTPEDDITASNFNLTLEGQIYWVAAVVIWFVSTVTQKYSRKKPRGYEFFYYSIGIYFFYIGLCSALDLVEEGVQAFKA